jgi:hypothetical protein
MPKYCVTFEVTDPGRFDMPVGEFENGCYEVIVNPDGGVDVFGNRQGLLYLAEVLTRCAIGGFEPGVHVHLQTRGLANGPNLDGSPELTIFAAGTLNHQE